MFKQPEKIGTVLDRISVEVDGDIYLDVKGWSGARVAGHLTYSQVDELIRLLQQAKRVAKDNARKAK